MDEINVRKQALKTKLKIIKENIHKWREQKKLLTKEGKKTSARRIGKKIKNLKDVAQIIELGQDSLLHEVLTEEQQNPMDTMPVVETAESPLNAEQTKHNSKHQTERKQWGHYHWNYFQIFSWNKE